MFECTFFSLGLKCRVFIKTFSLKHVAWLTYKILMSFLTGKYGRCLISFSILIIASCICPTKCGPRGNKTLLRFITDYLRKYIGLISLIKGEAVDQSHRYESHESHVKKIAKVNRDIQLCSPFSQNSTSFPWIGNSFHRIRQSVFSDCISFLRIAIVEIEGTRTIV